MATYIELRQLMNDGELPNKVSTAVIVYAQNRLANTPTLAEQKWAATVFSNPDSEGRKVLMGVLAANKGATVAQIQGATDAAIQTQVDVIAPSMVAALAGV